MITVDGISLKWNKKPMTIYQFLAKQDIILPCFCYHEKLNIAGNCRMCLVEANGKVVVSCAMPMDSPISITTSSELLSHCRENVLEFLLVNHPLDCPICDQGGECDLQDISKTFGLDRGRFYETKRSVDNLNCFGPMVKTLMTRCIHCTRCVRFLTEYCDEPFFGVIGRGSSMEIGSFTSSAFCEDPLSANVIDLCPVGALTSMASAFTARPWECRSIESIDIMDSLGAGLRFEVAHNQLVRCLPLITDYLNEDWMTNKARFVYYTLQRQKLVTPSLKVHGQWISISWSKAVNFILSFLLEDRLPLSVRTGNFIDLETACLAKHLCSSLIQAAPRPEFMTEVLTAHPSLFLFNSSLKELEETSLVIFIGCNLRQENPLMFLRLRRNYLRRRVTSMPLKVYSITAGVDYDNLPVTQLGCSVSSVDRLIKGQLNGTKDFFFRGFVGLHLLNIFQPLHRSPKLIIGPALFQLPQASLLQRRLWNFCLSWQRLLATEATIYNVALDYLGKLSLCAVRTFSEFTLACVSPQVIWNFMTETTGREEETDFVVYQGFSLPDTHISSVDLFLPTASPLEHSSYFLNVLGLVRQTQVVLSPLKTTYTDSQILYFVFRVLVNHRRYYPLEDTCEQFLFGKFKELFYFYYRIVLEHNWSLSQNRAPLKGFLREIPHLVLWNSLLTGSLCNYYYSDVYSRMSLILYSCSGHCQETNFASRIPC